MCGIVAVWSDGPRVEQRVVRRALDAMRHRGPDGDGAWVSEDGRVALAHVRLAVRGLSSGQQPLANPDGSIRLTINGEIYGHPAEGQCDSAMALQLYEEFGLDFVQHVRGEFALVLWDGRRNRLVAARDRFGIKPLCYTWHDGRLSLASEAKALFALGVPAQWDTQSFMHAATHQYLPPDRTLFEGISQVPPGNVLVAEAGQYRLIRYWDLDYGDCSRPPEAGELLSVLDDAVRVRLEAEVPIACCLSGGLDSSAVAALAARHLPFPLDCFGVSFEGDGYDEGTLAAEAAAILGARFHLVRVTQDDLLAHLSDAVWAAEGLTINGQLVGRYLLSRAVRDAGFKVVLSGEGADEVFLGYAHLQRDLYTHQERPDLVEALHCTHPMQAGVMLPDATPYRLPQVERLMGHVPSFLRAKVAMGRAFRELLCEDLVAQWANRDLVDEMLARFDIEGQLRGRHPVEQSAYLWTALALSNYILRTLGDGAEMAHSVEGRPPFLDHAVFELARRLPVTDKIRGSIEKYALREALRGVLPETIRTRTKHPFLAPPLVAHPTQGQRERIQDTLRSQASRDLPFLDSGKVKRWLDALWEKPDAGADPVLMMVLSSVAVQERLIQTRVAA